MWRVGRYKYIYIYKQLSQICFCLPRLRFEDRTAKAEICEMIHMEIMWPQANNYASKLQLVGWRPSLL